MVVLNFVCFSGDFCFGRENIANTSPLVAVAQEISGT